MWVHALFRTWLLDTNIGKSDFVHNLKNTKWWSEACWGTETLWSCVEPDLLLIMKWGPSDTILSMGCFRQTQRSKRAWAHELPILSVSCPETYSRTRRGWSNMHAGCFRQGLVKVVIRGVEQHEQSKGAYCTGTSYGYTLIISSSYRLKFYFRYFNMKKTLSAKHYITWQHKHTLRTDPQPLILSRMASPRSGNRMGKKSAALKSAICAILSRQKFRAIYINAS